MTTTCINDLPNHHLIGKRVSFWGWDSHGDMTKFTGTVRGAFDDTEDGRGAVLHVKLDEGQPYPYAYSDVYEHEARPL